MNDRLTDFFFVQLQLVKNHNNKNINQDEHYTEGWRQAGDYDHGDGQGHGGAVRERAGAGAVDAATWRACLRRCARRLLDAHVGAGQSSVGAAITVHHNAPTPGSGMRVTFRVTVQAVEGRKVVFVGEAETSARPSPRASTRATSSTTPASWRASRARPPRSPPQRAPRLEQRYLFWLLFS